MKVFRITSLEEGLPFMALVDQYAAAYNDEGVDSHTVFLQGCRRLLKGGYLVGVTDADEPVGFGMFTVIPSSVNGEDSFAVKQWLFCKPCPKAGLYIRAILGFVESLCQQDGVTELVYILSSNHPAYEPTKRFLGLVGLEKSGEVFSKRIL